MRFDEMTSGDSRKTRHTLQLKEENSSCIYGQESWRTTGRMGKTRGGERREREREMPDKRRKSEQWVRISINMPSPTTGTYIQGRLGLH
jgi:hypothetical protein